MHVQWSSATPAAGPDLKGFSVQMRGRQPLQSPLHAPAISSSAVHVCTRLTVRRSSASVWGRLFDIRYPPLYSLSEFEQSGFARILLSERFNGCPPPPPGYFIQQLHRTDAHYGLRTAECGLRTARMAACYSLPLLDEVSLRPAAVKRSDSRIRAKSDCSVSSAGG